MIEIIGTKDYKGGNGKTYCEVYYTDDTPVTYGIRCGVFFTSKEYAEKLRYANSGSIKEGYDNKSKKRFLYVK